MPPKGAICRVFRVIRAFGVHGGPSAEAISALLQKCPWTSARADKTGTEARLKHRSAKEVRAAPSCVGSGNKSPATSLNSRLPPAQASIPGRLCGTTGCRGAVGTGMPRGISQRDLRPNSPPSLADAPPTGHKKETSDERVHLKGAALFAIEAARARPLQARQLERGLVDPRGSPAPSRWPLNTSSGDWAVQAATLPQAFAQ